MSPSSVADDAFRRCRDLRYSCAVPETVGDIGLYDIVLQVITSTLLATSSRLQQLADRISGRVGR